MAYTIISQNNSTTTLSDGVNTITVPSRVNLTSGNFTIVEVNNNMATLEDGDGNVYRDIPCVATLVDAGGGGGAVSSVNGKTGAVVLNATDVDAIPQYSTMPTADSSMLGEIAQFIGTTNANYTNGYFYKVSETGPSDPVFYYNNNDIEITNPTTFINTVNANTDGGLHVVDGSLMQINAHPDANNDWELDIYLQNPNGSGGYTDTDPCSLTVPFLASIGITKSSPSMSQFSTCVAYTTSTEPQIYTNWGGGFLIVNPQQFLSFASNMLGGASPIGNSVSVNMVGSSTPGTYDILYFIDSNQWSFTFTESEFESNLGLQILDPYAEVDFYPISEGIPPTYAWTRVDVQPAPEALPDQTGHSGEFLTTDGTDASWAAIDALPSQTGQSGKFLTTDGTDASWGYALYNQRNNFTNFMCDTKGQTNYYTNWSTSYHGGILIIGDIPSQLSFSSGENQTAIGHNIYMLKGERATLIGGAAQVNGTGSIAFGAQAIVSANYAIQINASGANATNSDANTVKIANANGNYEMMSANGTIPTARLTKVNSTFTLMALDWSSNTQTISVPGMTATGVVLVSPDPAYQADYTSAGIICTAQAADSLTFTCSTTPPADIDVNVVML